MKILLFGKSGQVGWELQRSLAPLAELIALDAAGAPGLCGDLENTEGVAAAVAAVRPAAVVNAAAYTAVDRAEAEPQRAHLVNAVATGALAQAAMAVGAVLVHYSTEHVFDGHGDTPWREDDPTGPLNAYGRSKLEGELRIAQCGVRALVLRTSWIHCARRPNFATTVLAQAAAQEAFAVVDDQVGAPTGADLVADVTAHALRAVLAEAAKAGTYHLAASGQASRHAYACFLLQQAAALGRPLRAKPERIVAVRTATMSEAAPRPHNSRLDTSRLRSTFGLQLPPWQQGVERMLCELPPTGP